jgi:hypothetical protein
MSYATSVQLTTYTGAAAPADADRLLARASETIDQALLTATYAVDSTGTATDADVLDALQKATCAQVEFWLTSDEEEDVLGPTQGYAVGGMQVQFGAGENRTTPLYLAPRAARHLRTCSAIHF